MSDDKNKTPEQEAAEAVIGETPVVSPGAGSPTPRIGRLETTTARRMWHTVTSSAYTSAELFRPDQAPSIKAYQEALAKADKGDVFALAGSKVTPQDVGIRTDLKPDVTQTYAEFELSERQTTESRNHELNREGVKTTGSIKTEIVKAAIYFAIGLLAMYVGIDKFSP